MTGAQSPQVWLTRIDTACLAGGLFKSDQVKPVINRTLSFSDIPAAIRYLEMGHAWGKTVITV